MSIFEKKEKNLNELINKLDVLTSTYSQSSYETEKIKTEKNAKEALERKIAMKASQKSLFEEVEIWLKLEEKIKKSRVNERT